MGELHLACAACKALQAQAEGLMRAGGDLAAEFTYCLSGLKSVSSFFERNVHNEQTFSCEQNTSSGV